MFSRYGRTIVSNGFRQFSTTNSNYAKKFKVTVCGAGGIGQPLALLLKTHPLIYKIALYDKVPHINGIAMDLSHIATSPRVKGHPDEELYDALECSDIVIITAGQPRKQGMTRDDVFDINAGIVAKISRAAAKVCPEAILEVVTNPVNSLLPIACEIYKQECVLNPKKIFGISTLDTQRAKVFAGDATGCNPECIQLSVIGGHSNNTMVPVFSQCKPKLSVSDDEIKKMTEKVRNAGDAVIKAKINTGSATLSMAYSAWDFTKSILRAKNCEENVMDNAFVMCDVKGTKYFALPFILNYEGISKFCELPKLSKYEQELLDKGLPEVKKNVKRGEDFAAKFKC